MKVVLFILIAVVLIGGSAMVLLRTAKKPKIPDSVKPKPYDKDSDSSGW
ncbi:MAG: hypothetical protein ABFS02_02255 [Pseudomonadota bacterium]